MTENHEDIEITKRGKLVAIVKEPAVGGTNPLFGSVKETIVEIADDFGAPLGNHGWKACQ